MEEAWSPGPGPLPPVPRKSHKTGPQPRGPKIIAKYGTFGSLEGGPEARGRLPGAPPGGVGLEGLGW